MSADTLRRAAAAMREDYRELAHRNDSGSFVGVHMHGTIEVYEAPRMRLVGPSTMLDVADLLTNVAAAAEHRRCPLPVRASALRVARTYLGEQP